MNKVLLAIALVFASSKVCASTEYTSIKLKNGLKAYLIEDKRQPIAVHMLWYDVGSADEVDGKTGLAHFHEHLMFKGTKNIPPQEFSKIIARLGGVDNASTSFDYTNYYQLINKKNIGTAMNMEADRMKNLNFSEEEYKTEQKVVLQERKQRIDNSPWGRFYEGIVSNFYSEHPYKTITIGKEEDIKNLKRQDSLDWYDKYYSPNNATLLIVGDLTPKKFISEVMKNYAGSEDRQIDKATWKKEPLFIKPKRFEMEDSQIKSPIYYKLFRVPSFFEGVAGNPYNKADIYNLIVLTSLLGDSSTGYLYEKLITEQDIANSLSVDYSPISKGESTLDVYLQIKDGVSTKKAEKALESALRSFIRDFEDTDKIENTKTRIIANQIYVRDDAMVYARQLGRFLSSGGTMEEYDSFAENINKVSLDSIKKTMKKYFTSKQYMDAWLLPESK